METQFKRGVAFFALVFCLLSVNLVFAGNGNGNGGGNGNGNGNGNEGGNGNLVTICHNGNTLHVNENALNEYTGFTEGACSEPVPGCMDSEALNYEPEATEDDESCVYNTAPVITLIGGDMEVTVGGIFTDPGATASDNEDGDITENISVSGSVNTAVIGEYTLSYNVTDLNEIAAEEKTRTVNVILGDVEDPEICEDELAWNYLSEGACEFPDDEEETTPDENNNEEEVKQSSKKKSSKTSIPSALASQRGEVLGESVGICEMYITDYMKQGQNNNPEQVTKLQQFLNEQNIQVPVTGFYGDLTTEAVKKFQKLYSIEVLQPWVNSGIVSNLEPTGIVYKTTRWKINNMVCGGSEAFPIIP